MEDQEACNAKDLHEIPGSVVEYLETSLEYQEAFLEHQAALWNTKTLDGIPFVEYIGARWNAKKLYPIEYH